MTRKTASPAALLVLLLAATACQAPPEPAAPDASAELQAIADAAWANALATSPDIRLREGLPVDKLWNVSYASEQRDFELRRGLLDRMARIDVGQLAGEELLTYDVLKWQMEINQEGLAWFWHFSKLTSYSSPNFGALFGGLPVATADDRERYVALVAQVPAYVEAFRQVVEGQVERGIVVPRAAMPGVLGYFGTFLKPPAESVFHVADARFAGAGLDDEAIATFRRQVADVVEAAVTPAWQGLYDYLAGDYQALAPESVGVARYPDGEAFYRLLVRYATTYDVTPEEIQQVGYEMVADLEEKMAAIRREVGFEGSRDDFHRYLKTDPRFFPKTPEEVAERIRGAADAFNARIGEYFLKTPAAAYDVRRLDPRLEGSMTYGYYEPPSPGEPTGVYYFNGSHLDRRSLLNLDGLAYHELVPGHHFQIGRQMENDGVPKLRQYLYPTAFAEGWGSYATYLGLEAGLLDDAPYSRYGTYSLELFLANRLVVDPGMNLLGWTLEQGREYMREHTLESETQIASETLRYSTDIPGQAVAYQMGKRRILELRAKAQAALGERFYIRRFHEAVVGSGALPLAVLEKQVDRFIAAELGRRL